MSHNLRLFIRLSFIATGHSVCFSIDFSSYLFKICEFFTLGMKKFSPFTLKNKITSDRQVIRKWTVPYSGKGQGGQRFIRRPVQTCFVFISCKISGLLVTMPLPRGRKSRPTKFSRTDDLPED